MYQFRRWAIKFEQAYSVAEGDSVKKVRCALIVLICGSVYYEVSIATTIYMTLKNKEKKILWETKKATKLLSNSNKK